MLKGTKTRSLFWPVVWILIYLVLFDLVLNIVFRYPEDPVSNPPSRFRQYFEYGRSVEGKLKRIKGEMAKWGWVDATRYKPLPNDAGAEGQVLVALYGMSHTNRLGEAIPKVDSRYVIRMINAPGATPNWSFTAFLEDIDRHQAKVVVLGIMTQGVPFINTTCGGTLSFDVSYAYTYPRYRVSNGTLAVSWPPFFTSEGFTASLASEELWREYRAWLSENDKYYDPLLFHESFLDISVIGRSLRRAYASASRQRSIAGVYGPEGFNTSSEEIQVLQVIIVEFAMTARQSGKIPFIYIINNRGSSDHLLQALQPVLNRDGIPFLSTHEICPPDDPTVFLPGGDNHFTDEKEMELAAAFLDLVEAELDASNAKQSGMAHVISHRIDSDQ